MKIVRMRDELVDRFCDAAEGKAVGFDVETSNTNINKARVSVIQVYLPELKTSVLFPINVVDAHLSGRSIDRLLRTYQTWTLTGHNLAYDVRMMLSTFGILPKGIDDDTYLLACMRQSKTRKLKELAIEADPSLAPMLTKFTDLMDIDEDADEQELFYSFENLDQVKYMALDPYLPYVVKPYLWLDSLKDAYEVERRVLIPLAKVSAEGIQVDLDRYHKAMDEETERKNALQAQVNEAAGYELKVNSAKQLQRFLFEEKGLPPTPIKTASGAISTSEESLKYLEGEPIIDTILDLKHSISVLSSGSKVESYLDENNKIHPQFNSVGIDGTGRIYTKAPSLNQWTWEMRSSIVPAEGNKFVHADWKAAELYIASYLAGQDNLLEVYRDGKDVHSYLAGQLLGVENPDKSQREVSKVCTFATMYGSEGGAVSRKLRCSEDEAKDLVSRYLRILSKIKDLRDSVQNEAIRTHITKTITGRPRVLENLYNAETIEKGKRQAFNTMIQGSCADLQKMAIIKLHEKYADRVTFKFTVFDSFLIEVPDEMSEEEIREIMDDICNFSDRFPGFKLRYDMGIAYDWRSAYELC